MTLSNPAQYISGRTVQEQMNSLIDYVDQRAAEVATDAIASDVAQVHSDAADAHTDALAAAASASAAAGTLANAVKKTGEASQSIAGDIAVVGNLNGGTIGGGATPITCGDLTAYGNVSLDNTALQGNLSVADPSALINLSGAGSVIVPTPTGNSEAATKKYVDDALDNYASMVRTTGNQNVAGIKTFTNNIEIKAGKNSKLLIYTNTVQGEVPATPSVTDIEFYRGTIYSGRIAETIESDGSAGIDIMIKANQLASKEGRIQMYEDIANSKFVLRFWNGNTWTVLG